MDRILVSFARLSRTLGFALALCLGASFNTPAIAGPEFSAPAPRPGFGALYIGRPFGWNTSVFSLPIEINGQSLVSLGPNEYTRVELRPGQYTIAVPNSFWTRAISGQPHPVKVSIRAGASYYLLPSRWAGKEYTTYTMVGTVVVPVRSAEAHASFSVQTGSPPRAFSGLSHTSAKN